MFINIFLIFSLLSLWPYSWIPYGRRASGGTVSKVDNDIEILKVRRPSDNTKIPNKTAKKGWKYSKYFLPENVQKYVIFGREALPRQKCFDIIRRSPIFWYSPII